MLRCTVARIAIYELDVNLIAVTGSGCTRQTFSSGTIIALGRIDLRKYERTVGHVSRDPI